jgi:S1-C subfamily serine protease
VVRVEGDVPATVPLADSSAARPGDPVVAIGSPLGAFTNTVTQGIISATERDFPGQPSAGEVIYSDLIQHDAAINPGNSGGPLFNLAGEVVGVNTLGLPQQNGRPVQGIFFAIPSNRVGQITEQLIAQGRVTYPFFGITQLPITDDLVARYELPVDYGVGVVDVEPGSPADEAGIQSGDIILEVAGQRIDQQNSFAEVLFAQRPGETVDVLIQRGDEQQTVQVTLVDQPPA